MKTSPSAVQDMHQSAERTVAIASDIAFIEFDLVRDYEVDKFIPKTDLLMVLFLTGNGFASKVH